jgi:hypothetical protein
VSNIGLSHMIKWYTALRLALNIGKINIIKFMVNSSLQYALNILVVMIIKIPWFIC